MKILYGLQMKQNLNDFLQTERAKSYAIASGTDMHAKMQHVIIDEKKGNHGDSDIIEKIQKRPDLTLFFGVNAKTEVPIAGKINGVFVSRRIDRLILDEITKTIQFIDYKTDINKTEFVEKYIRQIKEYAELLHSAYPDYKISGFILWLHNWDLVRVV